jgi:hypothetical protein
MVDKEPSPDLCPRMDLNPSEPSIEVREQSSGCIPFPIVENMGNTVEPYGVETWIAEKNFHIVLCGRISLFNGLDIFL